MSTCNKGMVNCITMQYLKIPQFFPFQLYIYFCSDRIDCQLGLFSNIDVSNHENDSLALGYAVIRVKWLLPSILQAHQMLLLLSFLFSQFTNFKMHPTHLTFSCAFVGYGIIMSLNVPFITWHTRYFICSSMLQCMIT